MRQKDCGEGKACDRGESTEDDSVDKRQGTGGGEKGRQRERERAVVERFLLRLLDACTVFSLLEDERFSKCTEPDVLDIVANSPEDEVRRRRLVVIGSASLRASSSERR